MTWLLKIARHAEKELERIPDRDHERIMAALREIRVDPFSGDLVKLKSDNASWRRRVGSYRIFFHIYPLERLVYIVDIKRRTSSTY